MTAPDVLQPSSPEEAVSLFEAGVTVIGGGTIVVPDLTSGRLRPERAMLLTGAGLAGITRDGSRVTIGATTPVSELETLSAPIGPCAANVADSEIRAQGTVGGNLCAGEGPEAPRGDLQGALLAVGATVRSAGAGGETTEPLEDFLPHRAGPAAARCLVRGALGRSLRSADPPSHPRLHGARRLGSARRRRHDPARGQRRRGPRGSAPECRGEGE